jgi:HD-like signal output (HDOD) protein
LAIVQVDELIRKAQELSPLPTSVIQLARLAGSPETDLEQIVDVMAYDQALTMRLLRAANAVTEANSNRVLLARDAVFRLGTARILALAIAASVQPILRQDAAG